MYRTRGMIAAACLLTCVAACSTETATAPSTSASPSSTAAPTSTSATMPTYTFTPLVSPAKVTAACPFLDTHEGLQIIGNLNYGFSPGREGAVDPIGDGGGTHTCSYSWGTLFVVTTPDKTTTAANLIKDSLKVCVEPAVTIPSVGESTKYCNLKDDQAMVLTGKRSHGEIRIGEVHLKRTKTETYTAFAKLVIDRL